MAAVLVIGFELVAGRRLRAARNREYVQELISEARQGSLEALNYLRRRGLLKGIDSEQGSA